MESIFKSESWKIERKSLESKNLEVFETSNVTSGTEQIGLEYLNPLYYDGEVRIDIELDGELHLSLNDYSLTLNSISSSEHCIVIKNWSLICGNDKTTIDQKTINELKLLFNSSTSIKKFTIIQDLFIEGCNK